MSGTAQVPIIIRAKDGEVPIITRPDAKQNTINITNASYVVLKGLEVTNGSHGIRMDHSSFITIEECEIHDTGDVALSANTGAEYEGLQILRNHIHDTNDTGEGMYLGCNNNACQMFDSLIEGNYVHHTNGPTVVQGDGIEIKEGSYNNIVRDNVIHDTNYPCISHLQHGRQRRAEHHRAQRALELRRSRDPVGGRRRDPQQHHPRRERERHREPAAPVGQPGKPRHRAQHRAQAGGDAIRSDGIIGSVVIANNALFAQDGSAIRVGGDLAGSSSIGQRRVGGFMASLRAFGGRHCSRRTSSPRASGALRRTMSSRRSARR